MTDLPLSAEKASASKPLLKRFRNIPAHASGLFQAFGNLLFPPRCASCDAEFITETNGQKRFFCEECLDVLLSPEAVCRRCGASVPPEAAGCAACAECRPQKIRFDAAVSLGPYEGPLRMSVLSMKRAEGELLALGVGTLLAGRLEDSRNCLLNEEKWPELVVPIPIHWTQRATRGFSGPETIAESLAGKLALPVALDLLKWRRKPRQQSTLTLKERIRNVRGAFRVSTSYDIDGAKVLLVDDVMTSRATANEAAKTLKKFGASVVTVAVAARSTQLV